MEKKYKARPLSHVLTEKFGGKWKYQICDSTWRRADGAYCAHVLTGRDYDGEYTGESRLCVYFKDRSPEWLY